jgi:hypothetical protein
LKAGGRSPAAATIVAVDRQDRTATHLMPAILDTVWCVQFSLHQSTDALRECYFPRPSFYLLRCLFCSRRCGQVWATPRRDFPLALSSADVGHSAEEFSANIKCIGERLHEGISADIKCTGGRQQKRLFRTQQLCWWTHSAERCLTVNNCAVSQLRSWTIPPRPNADFLLEGIKCAEEDTENVDDYRGGIHEQSLRLRVDHKACGRL